MGTLEGNVSFRICVADLAFDVRCVYPATERLCRDYLTDKTPVQTIAITPADIEQERQRLLRKKNPGEALEASSPEALERLHLCRRIAELLPQYDRVLFHGSSLSIDGTGVLFTAKSGTGKSTHTRLWRQVFGDRVRMVNDDKPFLHIGADAVTVYGTPWRGKHSLGDNISAPLKAVYFVNRGETNRVETMTARELYPLLLQQTYTPENPAAMAKTLALVERLSRNVQLLRLYCNMDPEAAQIARRGLNL
jgi:hypothetical protein